MIREEDSKKGFLNLNRIAEIGLSKQCGDTAGLSNLSRDELQNLVQELLTRQMALEGLNEQLRHAQQDAQQDAQESSYNRYRDRVLCEHSPVALSIMSADGVFEYLNPRFIELFGYSLDDVPDRDSWFLTAYPDPEHRSNVGSVWQATTSGPTALKRDQPVLVLARCKGGIQKIVRCRIVVLDDGKQISTYSDVTEEVRLRELLVKAKQEWERAFDSVSELVLLIDKERAIIRANKAVTRFFGLSFAEVIGKKCHEILHQSDYPSADCSHCEISEGRVHACTGEFNTANGKILATVHTPLLDEHGNYSGVVLIARDVTDERARENQLRLGEQRFRAIFESSRDPFFAKDTSCRYTLVNPAMEKILGMTASEIVERSADELFDDELSNLVHATDQRVLAGEVVEHEVIMNVLGEPTLLLFTKSPLIDNNGEVVGICGIGHDLTGRKPIRSPGISKPISGQSQATRSTLEQAMRVAKFDTTVLLTGETGAGKDFFAKFIHDNSRRSGGPYFSVNCASLPSDLAESELFGHEGGAFTGARKLKRGMLELAEGGTLLLNEIGELSLGLQAKLLTFLDIKQFLRVGGEQRVHVNARIMAATNRDLEKEAASGRFRSDLLYRLNVYRITVPPLRERLEDLPAMAERILLSLAAEFQLSLVPWLSPSVTLKLRQYPWPGNVRELRNVLERALILSQGGPLTEACIVLPDTTESEHQEMFPIPAHKTLNEVVTDLKRSLVNSAIRRCQGNKTQAARVLGIPRSSLANYVKE